MRDRNPQRITRFTPPLRTESMLNGSQMSTDMWFRETGIFEKLVEENSINWVNLASANTACI